MGLKGMMEEGAHIRIQRLEKAKQELRRDLDRLQARFENMLRSVEGMLREPKYGRTPTKTKPPSPGEDGGC